MLSTEKQIYTSGKQTSDTLNYNNSSSTNTSSSASNSDTYTATTPKGTSNGSDFFLTGGSAQTQNNASGSLDLLAKSSTVNSTSIAISSGWGISLSTSSSGTTSFLETVGSNYSNSIINGGFNSKGAQTSGTSYNYSQDGGLFGGFTSSNYQATGYPSSTYLQTVAGGYGDNGVSVLNANSDGTANGILLANSGSSMTTDTTTTLAGTQKLTSGTAEYNNKNHSHDVNNTSSQLLVFLSSGNANGNVTSKTNDQNAWDFQVNLNVTLNDNLLYAQLAAAGRGSTGVDDTVNAELSNNQLTATRTFVFTQKGNTSSTLSANGNLKDNAGHTGSWWVKPNAQAPGSNGNAPFVSAYGSVDDRVTINLVWNGSAWNETGRTFSIDHQSGSGNKFHEEDNGLNRAAVTDPSYSETATHTLDGYASSTETTNETGTQNNFAFKLYQKSKSQSVETSSLVWSNTAANENGTFDSNSKITSISLDDRTGTDINNQRTLSSLGTWQGTDTESGYNRVVSSPHGASDAHNTVTTVFLILRDGSLPGTGTGSQSTFITTATWGSSPQWTDGAWKQQPWSSETPLEIGPKIVDLSWPNATTGEDTLSQLKADFQSDPLGQWLSANGSSVLQIGLGFIDVVGGLAMTLGTCGGAVIPGVGLTAIGIDQIITGAYNMGNPGLQSMSAISYLGYSGAKGAGLSEQASQLIGELAPTILSIGFNVWGSLAACFAAGTPLLTPDGDKPIEQFQRGDWVLSAPECDPEAPPEPRQVEEVFVNLMPLLELQVGGRTIHTTSEHPFYVRGKGWTAAKELQAGDRLRSHDGQWKAVESVKEGEGLAPVYNLRVAEDHTYFVGSRDWGFSVWAHNACFKIQEGVRRSVAAREAGLSGIMAEVFDNNGRLLRKELISLTDLFSPKASILRDARYLRALSGMQTPAGQALMPLISVIEVNNVQGLTALLQVLLN